jgi:chromosome segregation ATPase
MTAFQHSSPQPRNTHKMTATEDPRVADYLDDKLQTLADLESLDSLLLAVRDQQSKLKQQLQDAHKDLEGAKHAAQGHGSSLKTRVKDFDREQVEIDRKLRDVTQSSTSDEAVRKFEVSMGKLNKLTMAKEYVRLLRDVDSLRYEQTWKVGDMLSNGK